MDNCKAIVCRYGEKCTKAVCDDVHLYGRVGPAPCRFGTKCTRPDCTFGHPADRVEQPAPKAKNHQALVCIFDLKCKKPGCWSLHPKRDARAALSACAQAPKPVIVPLATTTEYVIPVPYTTCPYCMGLVFSGKCGCKREHLPIAAQIIQETREIEELFDEAPKVVEDSTDDEDEEETAEGLAFREEDALLEEALDDAELAEEYDM
jgi:hypothetical protein